LAGCRPLGTGGHEAWQRPPKKRITLFLDADVLAWFREEPKYTQRINQALREVMQREKEESQPDAKG